MTDPTSTPPTGGPDRPHDESPPGAADETFAWTTEPDAESATSGSGQTAERMVGQLQSMIDSIATQAAPVVRQIGIKAAELAAAAADRAGPIAHKAADATADASVRIAERSRVIAAELRRDVASASPDGGAATTAVLDDTPASAPPAAEPVDTTSADDPAEGPR
jgi:hypothetical protein